MKRTKPTKNEVNKNPNLLTNNSSSDLNSATTTNKQLPSHPTNLLTTKLTILTATKLTNPLAAPTPKQSTKRKKVEELQKYKTKRGRTPRKKSTQQEESQKSKIMDIHQSAMIWHHSYSLFRDDPNDLLTPRKRKRKKQSREEDSRKKDGVGGRQVKE